MYICGYLVLVGVIAGRNTAILYREWKEHHGAILEGYEILPLPKCFLRNTYPKECYFGEKSRGYFKLNMENTELKFNKLFEPSDFSDLLTLDCAL